MYIFLRYRTRLIKCRTQLPRLSYCISRNFSTSYLKDKPGANSHISALRREGRRDKAVKTFKPLARPANCNLAQRFRIYQMNVGGARAIKRKRDKSRSAPSCVKRRPAAPLIYSRRCLLIGRVVVVVVPVGADNWITRCKNRARPPPLF